MTAIALFAYYFIRTSTHLIMFFHSTSFGGSVFDNTSTSFTPPTSTQTSESKLLEFDCGDDEGLGFGDLQTTLESSTTISNETSTALPTPTSDDSSAQGSTK